MTRALLTLLTSVVALAATHRLLTGAIPRAPLRRANYRGIRVATGLGVVLVAGMAMGASAAGLLYGLGARAATASIVNALPVLAATFGFSLLGLWDDLYGAAGAAERGFAGHVGALREGRITGGALKMLAGSALAVAVAAPHATTFGWLLIDAATIALMANLFNGFDLRPGRALKFFAVGALPLAIFASPVGVALGAGLGAAVAALPQDLRERAMLGDAGSNALGAMLGAAIVYTGPASWLRLTLVGVLIVLTAVADRIGLGSLIASTPGLRAFDRLGRVQEEPVA